MTKTDILDRLFSLQRFGIKPGLERTFEILADRGDPQDSFPSVHIAGTNGKGFTCSAIASILMEAGYRVGLYTSPHLKEFNERIIINGRMISDEDIVLLAKELIPYSEKINATFFEITTAMAFIYFAQQDIDIAVIETGMGGRFDSTNVLKPQCSIITDIGLEHTEYLGDKLEDIAYEKAGIIKSRTPCIISSKNYRLFPVFQKKAEDVDSSLFFAEEMVGVNVNKHNKNMTMGIKIAMDDLYIENINVPFAGKHHIKNLKLALSGLKMIRGDFSHNEVSIKSGLINLRKNTNYRCRMELLRENPPVLIDTAHNPQAIKALVETIKLHGLSDLKWDILYAAMEDKDVESILKYLRPICNSLILTEPKIDRSMQSEKLAEKAKKLGYRNIDEIRDAGEAYDTAVLRDRPLLVCGSFFLAGELL